MFSLLKNSYALGFLFSVSISGHSVTYFLKRLYVY